MDLYSLFVIFAAEYLVYILPVAVLAVSYRHKSIILFMKTLMAGSVALMLGQLIKIMYFIPRPFVISGKDPLAGILLDGSFPSNHTAFAFALGIFVAKKYPRSGVIVLLLAVLVALGRILGGVHTLTDILGGVTVALISVLISDFFLTVFAKFRD